MDGNAHAAALEAYLARYPEDIVVWREGTDLRVSSWKADAETMAARHARVLRWLEGAVARMQREVGNGQ